MPHPSFETLLEYIENTLSPADRAEVESHLSHSCTECDQQIIRLRNVLQTIQRGETSAPPAEVFREAVALYGKHRNGLKPFVPQIIAKLLFDSHLQMSSAMVRGTTQTRRVLYSTKKVDIDIQITPEEGCHSLFGQVLDTKQPDDFTQAFVSMKNNTTGEIIMGKETDSLGQFHFQAIPPGQYDLVFELDSQEVAIRSLELAKEI
jgi:hypothetical protein